MLRTKTKKQITGPILATLFITVILIASLFVNTNPEHRELTSEDQGITIIAQLPEDLEVIIATDESTATKKWTAVASKIYTVTPDYITLPTFITVQMPIKDTEENQKYTIARYDKKRSFWIPIETIKDNTRQIFEAKTDKFSQFALLKTQEIEIYDSDKEKLIQEALKAAPESASAYRIDISYATEPGDFILLQENTQLDKCNARSLTKTKEITTMIDRAVTIKLNKKIKSGEIRATVTWETGGGCESIF